MSIQDISQKLNLFFRTDAYYYGVLILLIGVASFGLGRLSVLDIEFQAEKGSVEYFEPEVGDGAYAVETTETTGDIQYVGSKNSNKYHLPWCSGAKRIKEENKIFFATVALAEQAGYEPAGNCEGL